jgi:TATA-box binding protein (TBP) (component of TFIID and TFIIIB)
MVVLIEDFNKKELENQVNDNMTSENIIEKLKLNIIPKEIIISTMTIICKSDIIFNVKNIGYFLELGKTSIFSINYGSDIHSNRTLNTIKKKRNIKNKKAKKNFYNQVSIVVFSDEGKKINIKLFSNGSIQMTGCKDIVNSISALKNLFNELKKIKAVYDPIHNEIIEKPFVKDNINLNINNITHFKIAMINSNFNIGFKVDRDKLFEMLSNNKTTECSYDPIIHACVNIKYDCNDKTVSIFVFESGSIIITGANNGKHILDAYNFINQLLCNNYKQIYKSNILSNSTIMMYLT